MQAAGDKPQAFSLEQKLESTYVAGRRENVIEYKEVRCEIM